MPVKELPAKFAKVMEQVRIDHPLPHEHSDLGELRLDELLLPLRRLDSAAWARMCQHFDTRLDPLIFPCFAEVCDEKSLKRLQQLCRSRCGWALYEQGWSCFQKNFPNRALQLAFAEMYATLRQDPYRYGSAPAYIIDYLPARVDFSLTPEQIVQRSYEVLKEHLTDYRNRHPGKTLGKAAQAASNWDGQMRYALPGNAGLMDFFRHYNIEYRQKFGSHILGLHFHDNDDHYLSQQHQLLADILANLPQTRFMELMNRTCHSTELSEEERAPLFRIFFQTLESNPGGKDIWTQLPRRTRQTFMSWHIWSVMGAHYAMNPRKQLVMQEFLSQIIDVAEFNAQTVVWRFQNFYLLDSWDDMDHSYYYPKQIFDESIVKKGMVSFLSATNLPYRSLSRDNLRQAAAGVVKLSFVKPQLDLTLDFLNRLTGNRQSSRHAGFSGWR